MSRFFNGSYSVRPGYHGARKSAGSGVGSCPEGHIYSLTEIVDNRASGGSCYRRKITECPRCKSESEPVVAQSNQGALCSMFEELIEE